jgi:hypothetical protein
MDLLFLAGHIYAFHNVAYLGTNREVHVRQGGFAQIVSLIIVSTTHQGSHQGSLLFISYPPRTGIHYDVHYDRQDRCRIRIYLDLDRITFLDHNH